MLAAFVTDLAFNCRSLAAAFRAISWEASPLWLGLLAAGSPACYTLGCLTLGRWSDHLGRRASAVSGLALTAVFILAHYFAAQVWQLFIFASLSGAALSLFWPTVSAWFSDLAADTQRGLNRALGNFNVAWSSGMVLGALLGGGLYRFIGPGTFLVLVGLLFLVALGLLRVPQVRQGAEGVSVQLGTEEPVAPALTARFLLSARLVSALAWFMTGVNLTILPKLANLLGMPESQTGLAIAAYYVAVVAFFWVGRTSSRWQYRRWPIVLPVPLAVVGMGAVAAARSLPFFALGCFIAGACTALAASTALYYALHGRVEGRAASTAIHEAVVGLGAVAGAIVSGLVAEAMTARLGLEASLRGCFLLVAALAILIGLAQVVAWQVMRRSGAKQA